MSKSKRITRDATRLRAAVFALTPAGARLHAQAPAARFGATIVYRSERAQRASEYRTPEALAWRDYEWSGLFRLPARVGNGFLLYTDLVAARYYHVRFTPSLDGPSGYRLLKAGLQPLEGRTLSGFVPRPGAWYRVRTCDGKDAQPDVPR